MHAELSQMHAWLAHSCIESVCRLRITRKTQDQVLRVSQRARYRFLLLHQESLSRVLGAHHPNMVA